MKKFDFSWILQVKKEAEEEEEKEGENVGEEREKEEEFLALGRSFR